jgi:hypothetical protein
MNQYLTSPNSLQQVLESFLPAILRQVRQPSVKIIFPIKSSFAQSSQRSQRKISRLLNTGFSPDRFGSISSQVFEFLCGLGAFARVNAVFRFIREEHEETLRRSKGFAM